MQKPQFLHEPSTVTRVHRSMPMHFFKPCLLTLAAPSSGRREVQQDTGSCPPSSRCNIDLFVHCLPPALSSSHRFPLFLLLLLSVSVSSSASLAYVTRANPQHTDEENQGSGPKQPGRKRGLRCTTDDVKTCVPQNFKYLT